jgi:ADP-dependent NAD(P)H-hydrate dehydratase / NAD(P)H-hydrate epimerase
MDILTVTQMREIERAADAAGLSYSQMMQNAGTAAAHTILQRLAGHLHSENGDTPNPARVLILVGPGNNGGDGLVCARVLHEQAPTAMSLSVQVYLLKPRAEDDPVYAPVRDSGIFIADATDDLRLRVLHQLLSHADVIVDALLGTGVARPIDGTLRDLLAEVRTVLDDRANTGTLMASANGALRNSPIILSVSKGDRTVSEQRTRLARPFMVALDGVTGMNYDTGALDPCAVPADLCITFHAPKRGQYCFPAARCNGELVVVGIGLDRQTLDIKPNGTINGECVALADRDMVRSLLPARTPDANKGTNGRVVVIGGCVDYSGAPTLVAEAAYRAGAGLVTLAVPSAIQPVAAALCREVTFASLSGTTDYLSVEALPRLVNVLSTLDNRHAVIVGPGMGQHPLTKSFLLGLLDTLRHKEGGARLVMDADALNLLAGEQGWPALLPPVTILTPHPGEMARLSGLSVKDIQADRIGIALKHAQLWGHIVVLKGAYTVIADPNDKAVVLPFANAALAVAGTGDVLAGCIGSMLAQGAEAFDAATCGAYLHAEAGEGWRLLHGDAGMLAGELLPFLPDVRSKITASGPHVA